MKKQILSKVMAFYSSLNLSEEEQVAFFKNFDTIVPAATKLVKSISVPVIYIGESITEFPVCVPDDYPEKEFAGMKLIAKILPTMEVIPGKDYVSELQKKDLFILGSMGLDLLVEFAPEQIPEGKYILSPKKGKNEISRMHKNGSIRKDDDLVSVNDLIYPGNYFVAFSSVG